MTGVRPADPFAKWSEEIILQVIGAMHGTEWWGRVNSAARHSARKAAIRVLEVLAAAPVPPSVPTDYGPGKCRRCGWTLAESVEKGCVAGNCSYRPDDPNEQRRLRERMEGLAAAEKQPPGAGT